MKRALAVLASLVLAASATLAGTDTGPAVTKNASFEALKALAGTWTGPAGPAGSEAPEATVVYTVTGAGSALEERMFPGTPHEMVTMYHMDGDALVLTHYCAAGNQPRMKLASSDGKTLSFAFDGGTNMKAGDMHMHEAKITLVDADHIKSEWTAWVGGKPDHTMSFTLSRKK